MRSGTLLLAILLATTLCLQFSPEVSAATAAAIDEADYYYGDDAEAEENVEQDADYEDNVATEVPEEKPAELRANPPYFVEPEMEIYTQASQDLLIDCTVKNIKSNNVILWYKGKTVIATGEIAISQNVDVFKNHSLIVKNVTVMDAGDYYCEVLPEKIRMHALVEVDESLMIFCDGQEVTNRSLVFRQGEPHHCECRYYSLENVQIKWFIDGKRAETIVERVLGEQLFIDNVDTKHGGIYQCLADDRSQEPPHAMVVVEVIFAPKVATYRHYVNAEHRGEAELYCDYTANPVAEVLWLRNDKVLATSYKYAFGQVPHKGRNRSILTVLDLQANDLGEYTCRVQNTVGAEETRVHIIYEPEHPQLEDIDINGNKVVIRWLVRSMQPLSEAVLDYKMAGAYTWSKVTVVHTHRHVESQIWKVTHEMELTPGSWHVRMRAKNTVGWSAFSAQHDFEIADDDEDDLDTADAPGNMIAMAGFGGGSKSVNSCDALRISQALLGAVGACAIFLFPKSWVL